MQMAAERAGHGGALSPGPSILFGLPAEMRGVLQGNTVDAGLMRQLDHVGPYLPSTSADERGLVALQMSKYPYL